MPGELSNPMVAATRAQQTDECPVFLLELSHPSLAVPIRVCDDAVDTVSGGVTYIRFPFRLVMPERSDEAPRSARLQIDNVDRRITQAIRSVGGEPIKVTVRLVLASSPDVVEGGPAEFVLRNVSFTAATVEGELVYDIDPLTEPYPAQLMSPTTVPGIF